MRSKMKLRILAGLASLACSMLVFTATHAANSPSRDGDTWKNPIEAQAYKAWGQKLAQTPPSTQGCFHATYPSVIWKPVACNAATLPSGVRRAPAISSSPLINIPRISATPAAVDNTNGYVLVANGLITQTTASFPSVSGVTSTSDSLAGTDEYSLQILAAGPNVFPTYCNIHGGPANCSLYEQFVYATWPGRGAPPTNAFLITVYWLMNWGPSCPTDVLPSGSPWSSDGSGNCFGYGTPVSAPLVPPSQLGDVQLTVTETGAPLAPLIIAPPPRLIGSFNFTFTFTDGIQAQASNLTDPDPLGLTFSWTQSTFNVFGQGILGPSSGLNFNSGSSLTAQVTAAGAITSAVCAAQPIGSGAFTPANNLTPGTCTLSGGPVAPSIQFTESN